MFCRFRRKTKKNGGRNQAQMKLLIYSSLFATGKECFAMVKLKPRMIAAMTKRFATTKVKVRHSEEKDDLKD